MYKPNYWLIELKNRAPDLNQYTIHMIAEKPEDACRMAEELYGTDCLACEPVLDNPK